MSNILNTTSTTLIMDRAPPPFPNFLVHALNTCFMALSVASTNSPNATVPPPFLPIMNMIAVVAYFLQILDSRMPISGRRRGCIVDVKNRVLLAVIWLRNYPTYYSLASLFAISKSTVQEEIYHVVPILFLRFRNFITWHNIRQWSSFLGQWRSFPNAVGIVDATIHRIRRPSGRMQAEFYRGDKKTHFMSTQLIVDANGMIVMLISG